MSELGNMPEDKEDEVQNTISSIKQCFNKASERGKMSAVQLLNKIHTIDVDLFTEL